GGRQRYNPVPCYRMRCLSISDLTRPDRRVPIMKVIRASLLILALFAIAAPAFPADDDLKPLFDGKSLDVFEQHGGKAKYALENGEIVGTSVQSTPNSFLCTKQKYGDFVLELEFKVDRGLNWGVQIRSEVFDKETEIALGDGKKKTTPADRVHGY